MLQYFCLFQIKQQINITQLALNKYNRVFLKNKQFKQIFHKQKIQKKKIFKKYFHHVFFPVKLLVGTSTCCFLCFCSIILRYLNSPINLFHNRNYIPTRPVTLMNMMPDNFPAEKATFSYTDVYDCENKQVTAVRLFQNLDDGQQVITESRVFISPGNLISQYRWIKKCFSLDDKIINGDRYKNFITVEDSSEDQYQSQMEFLQNKSLYDYTPKQLVGLYEDEDVTPNTTFAIHNIRMADGSCHPALTLNFQGWQSGTFGMRIFPSNLHWDHDYVDQSSKFCWRNIQGHKVLTVESGKADIDSDPQSKIHNFKLLPSQFSLSNYKFAIKVHTCNRTRINVVTSTHPTDQEIAYWKNYLMNYFPQNSDPISTPGQVSPYDLVGTNSYRSDITPNTQFRLEPLKLCGKELRAHAVTLVG